MMTRPYRAITKTLSASKKGNQKVKITSMAAQTIRKGGTQRRKVMHVLFFDDLSQGAGISEGFDNQPYFWVRRADSVEMALKALKIMRFDLIVANTSEENFKALLKCLDTLGLSKTAIYRIESPASPMVQGDASRQRQGITPTQMYRLLDELATISTALSTTHESRNQIDATLEEQRLLFLESLPLRFQGLMTHAAKVGNTGTSAEACDELKRKLHRLRKAANFYGFHSLCEFSRTWDRGLDKLCPPQGDAPQEEVQGIATLANFIQEVVQAPTLSS